MDKFIPFDAWTYDTYVAGPMDTLCCPPYDVISPAEQAELEKSNPNNAIWVERPSGDDPYAAAAKKLADWKRAGVISQKGEAFFVYEIEFRAGGKTYKLRALTGRCRLSRFDEGQVLPHENTLSKAKADRFDLMTATKMNISPVYSLYTDPGHKIPSLIEGAVARREPSRTLSTPDGVTHRVWRADDADFCKSVRGILNGKRFFIADGHHRYETALNYRDSLGEIPEDHPANYVMMTLVDMENPGLVILPTHRVVFGCADGCVEKLLESVKSEPVDIDEMPLALSSKRGAIGLCTADGAKLIYPDGKASQTLDVTRLHELVLEPYFGIDAAKLAEQGNLLYTRDIAEAVSQVDGGKAQCAFFLAPTRISQLRQVSLSGGKMPQKSTYFYPKLITGLYFNDLSI